MLRSGIFEDEKKHHQLNTEDGLALTEANAQRRVSIHGDGQPTLK
jgi:hypothetical protein